MIQSERLVMEDPEKRVYLFLVNIVNADVLVPSVARASADTKMTKLGSQIYTWLALEG